MFSVPYPTRTEIMAHVAQARRLRGSVTAHFIRDIARWIATAAR